MDNSKDKDKEDNNKGKNKVPTYKLQSNIKPLVDMKNILKNKILDEKIVFILRKILDITKKDFYEFIINIIKIKMQIIAKIVMTRVLDT